MKKPKHLSHYLIITALINGERVSTADAKIFYTARLENIITQFRNDGLKFVEDARSVSAFSWFKLYRLHQSDENLLRAIALQNEYKRDIEGFNPMVAMDEAV